MINVQNLKKVKKTNTVMNIYETSPSIGLMEFYTNKNYTYSVEMASFCNVYSISYSWFHSLLNQKCYQKIRVYKCKFRINFKWLKCNFLWKLNYFRCYAFCVI